MIKQLVRRSSLALLLASSTVATVGTAHAGVTGTDPCPVGWHCVVQAPAGSAAPVAPGAGAVAQVLMVLFGLA